jgi:hypothetical protein
MKRKILCVLGGVAVSGLLATSSHAAILQTVAFDASGSVPANSGTGNLNGSVSYSTAAVGAGQEAAGFTGTLNWSAILGATVPGESGTSSNTSGTLGETNAGTTETITFGTPVVNPIFMGAKTDPGVTYNFTGTGASSLTLLSANNAILNGDLLTFAGSSNLDSDAFGLQLNGTFSSISFVASDAAPVDTQSFTVASSSTGIGGSGGNQSDVPEPASLSLLAFGTVPLLARRRKSVR